MLCAEFEVHVLSKFGYLFDNWGFKIVAKKTSRFGDRCLMILQSDQFKIKLYQSPDEVNLLVGTISSPSTWDNSKDGENVWHYIRGVIRYLNNDLSPIDTDAEKWSERTFDRQTADLAEMLKKNIDKINGLFGINNFDSKKQDYYQFLSKLYGGSDDVVRSRSAT